MAPHNEEQPEHEASQSVVDLQAPEFVNLMQQYDHALKAMINGEAHFAKLVASHARNYEEEMASALSQTSQNLDNANNPVRKKLELYNDPQQVRGWRHQSVFWAREVDWSYRGNLEDYQPSPVEVKAYDVSTHLIEAYDTLSGLFEDFKKVEIELKKYLMESISLSASNEEKNMRSAVIERDKQIRSMKNYFAERARKIRGETAPDATVEPAIAPEPQPQTPATHSSGIASDNGSPGGSLGEQSRSKRGRTE